MSVAFQFVDVAVVAIIVISAIYATYRGFVSESLSIFAWIAAALATLYFGPWVSYWLRGMINPSWLGEVVGYAAVFLVVVIPLSFMSFRFSESVKKSQVSTLDGALGLAFGILRGLAIVGIAYLVFSAFISIPEQPGWITKARLLPLIQASADVVASVIPDQHVGTERKTRDKSADEAFIRQQITNNPAPPATKPTPKKKPVKKTYGAKDRQALDRLIETSGSNESGKP